MAGRFEGRTAVVAGGSSGFGLDAARSLISEGAGVVIAARNEERLRSVADEIGAVGVVCDIADNDSVAELAAVAVERFGRIDIAINSAGIEDQAPIRNLTPEKLEPMVTIQFTGAVYFIRHMAAAMSEGGSIITVSSLTASLVPENYAAYAGAKAGINHVTRIAAAEYGPDGIRVNTVAPSIIETPMTRHILAIPAVREAFLSAAELNSSAWQTVRVPGKSPQQYARALRAALAACDRDPANGSYLNTLGVAQFRAGKFAEALGSLRRSDEINRRRSLGGQPEDTAFLAMTLHRLGKSEAAGIERRRLLRLMKSRGTVSEEHRALLAEVDALFGQ